MLSAEAEHLVHHVHRARFRIGRVHAEGAAQDVGLHARHLHVHELPRPRRRRDFRRAHGHEPDVAPHLLVHQNGRVLVAKRHRLSCRVSGHHVNSCYSSLYSRYAPQQLDRKEHSAKLKEHKAV